VLGGQEEELSKFGIVHEILRALAPLVKMLARMLDGQYFRKPIVVFSAVRGSLEG